MGIRVRSLKPKATIHKQISLTTRSTAWIPQRIQTRAEVSSRPPRAASRRPLAISGATAPKLDDETFARAMASLAADTFNLWKKRIPSKPTSVT